MYCKYCGADIPDDSGFCEKCGKKVIKKISPEEKSHPFYSPATGIYRNNYRYNYRISKVMF
jgi:predicted amidophosphoribosyltransferase